MNIKNIIKKPDFSFNANTFFLLLLCLLVGIMASGLYVQQNTLILASANKIYNLCIGEKDEKTCKLFISSDFINRSFNSRLLYEDEEDYFFRRGHYDSYKQNQIEKRCIFKSMS